VVYVGDPTAYTSNGPIIAANAIGVTLKAVVVSNGGNGIELRDARGVTIGGRPASADDGAVIFGRGTNAPATPIPPGSSHNVIVANGGHGILVSGRGDTFSRADVSILNNRIGVIFPESGATAGNGGSGIYLAGVGGVTVGGTVEVPATDSRPAYSLPAGNLNGGNAGDGITVTNVGTTPSVNVRIERNDIGVRPSGAPVGNGGWGVNVVGSAGVSVGADAAAAGNRIAYNVRGGVAVRVAGVPMASSSFGRPGERNPIRGNSIYNNGGLGIDLGADGVTPNDPGDVDSGANGLQNTPEVMGVTHFGVRTRISVLLRSPRYVGYTVHVYATPARTADGAGRPQVYLGAVSTSAGSVSFHVLTLVVPTARVPRHGWVTATATDAEGNTSEFSPAVNVSDLRPAVRPGGADAPATRPAGVMGDEGRPELRRVPPPREVLLG
jgi:hypothetical protein